MQTVNGDVASRFEAHYLSAAEAARLLHVSPKTVSRWAEEGKVPHAKTLGGHRRFPAKAIYELARRLSAETLEPSLR
jgi:excisionase family DNA binding protein